ncbi:MAG: 50S ribosomal protein L3 [Nitrospiraceae bacterium]|nr:50S ribosomal protein L3 [Nitrospiraceae bacterium]
MTGILGRKLGMSQIFSEDGRLIPVTVVEAAPGVVIEVKTLEKHGYEAIKVGFFEERKPRRVNKPEKGVFEKAGIKALYRKMKEYPMSGLQVGETVTVEKFAKGDKVSVSGTSKGKGFQGVMKRHNYAGGPSGHGSMFNRAPGSIGASSFPSRVWKGKTLPGHMGSERVTTRNVEIAGVKAEQNLILLRGSVPGATGSIVEIRKVD